MRLAAKAGLSILALLPGAWAQTACQASAPCYRAESIVNSASGQAGALAPYTFATIYGENLSYETLGRTPSDLLRTGIGHVQVIVNRMQATLFYVSPGQVNFLIPNGSRVGKVDIQVIREGMPGPIVPVVLDEVFPAVFLLDPSTAVAQRMPDFLPATPDAPARPGEYVILYATGLGSYSGLQDESGPPASAVTIDRRTSLQLFLDGVAVDDRLIEYAGTVTGYWGLYQINLKLPEQVGDNPEIRIAVAGRQSPAGVHIPLRNR